MSEDGIIRMKIEFENQPIMDIKKKKFKDLDEIFDIIKKKLG